MKTAFISGHLSLTADEFAAHYLEPINAAIEAGHLFVVGDAAGADAMAQEYLATRISKERVIVFHAYSSPRHNCGFATRGDFNSQNAKDKAMTMASDYDIAWVRVGREDSGTARNIARRKGR